MSKVGALEMLTGSNSETIIVKISALLSQHGVIFALLAGVILAGILASTMSTSDSQPVSYTHLTLPTNREV